jgi:hypothetical protein
MPSVAMLSVMAPSLTWLYSTIQNMDLQNNDTQNDDIYSQYHTQHNNERWNYVIC